MLVPNNQTINLPVLLLSTKEAAVYLGVSQGHIRNLVSAGKLPYKKLGARNRYLKSDLDALLVEGPCSPNATIGKSPIYSVKR